MGKLREGKQGPKHGSRVASRKTANVTVRGKKTAGKKPKVVTRRKKTLRLPSVVRVVSRDSAWSLATPKDRETMRRAVEDGLPVEAVRQLQTVLKRLGVSRPSHYVESIATRAARSRRSTLTPHEGERLVRVASVLARALDVWQEEEAAAEFLTSPHPAFGGESPIDRARSEIGARQVEDLLLRLDLGLPV